MDFPSYWDGPPLAMVATSWEEAASVAFVARRVSQVPGKIGWCMEFEVFHGFAWCLVVNLRCFMVFHGFSWLFMVFSG